jgi:hypothetical protein
MKTRKQALIEPPEMGAFLFKILLDTLKPSYILYKFIFVFSEKIKNL